MTALPTAVASTPPSASDGAPAYGPGQTLRATRSIPVTSDWTIGIGQVIYVIAVDGDRYEIQHWGGGFRLDDGGATWRPLAASNWSAPDAGLIVWAGSEAISLGQYPEPDGGGLTNSVAYDPVVDRWRAISACQISLHAVWTGTHVLGDHGAYDVAADVCLTLPTPPGRPVGGTTGREGSAYAWTGSEYLIWSGGNGSDYARIDGDGVIFRPERP